MFSVIFFLAVLANFAVMPLGNEKLGVIVGSATLVPLALMMLSGLFLYLQPYVKRARHAHGKGSAMT